MPLKERRPLTPGQRGMTFIDFSEITKSKPEKKLLLPYKRGSGRNNQGRITTRHRGGGHKKQYRIIDYKRDKDNVPAKVVAFEYDPNRNCRIALLVYSDGEKRYILAPNNLKPNDTVLSGENVEQKAGNSLPLRNIRLVNLYIILNLSQVQEASLLELQELQLNYWQKKKKLPQ